MTKTLRVMVTGACIGIAAGLGISGSAIGGEETRFKGVTLRMGTWGGATRDALRDYVANEIEKRGGKVEFVIGSPQDNFAKLIASRGEPPFDLMDFLGTMVPEMTGRNLLVKLNLANIPNTRYLQADEFNDLMVGTWNTQEVIIYNKDKLRDRRAPAGEPGRPPQPEACRARVDPGSFFGGRDRSARRLRPERRR